MINNIIQMNRLLKKPEIKTRSVEKPATTAFEKWIDEVVIPQKTVSSTNYSEGASNKNYSILYCLEIKYTEHNIPILRVHVNLAAKLKKGGYSSLLKKFSVDSNIHFQSMLPEDSTIIHRLELKIRKNNQLGSRAYATYRDNYLLSSEDGEIFEDLIKTNRCYWINDETKLQLKLGERSQAKMEWLVNDFGEQKLTCKVDEQLVTILPFSPLWYLNNIGICGKLELSLNTDSEKLLFMPALLPQDLSKMNVILKKHFKQTKIIPSPTTFKVINVSNVEPRPKLLLFGLIDDYYDFDEDDYAYNYQDKQKFILPLARISFIYKGKEIQLNALDNIQILDRANNVIHNIARNFILESKHMDVILQAGAKFYVTDAVENSKVKSHDFLIADACDRRAQENFVNNFIPKLKALGWEIVIDPSFPIEYIVAIEDWYTNVIETTEYNWFDLELGFVVDDQKINILPLLIELIKQDPKIFNEQFFNNNLEKNHLLTLANGQKVNIPVKRLQGIFAVLSELYDLNSLNKSGQLAVSRLRAAQLLELEKAMATTKLRWYGAAKLQELSKKLINFKAITPIKVPSIFKGTLRDYQQEGVNWLGFLREYQLGGILSDDMGLGKTIQALAHLAVEKKAKRLNNACLIVAPTSLMSNWKNEAKQFTPDLKVIVLQGQFRKQLFDSLKDADLILTTYALLYRDRDVLLNKEYDLVILDEAQYIKNANTNAYQMIQQLSSKHRICLTGTPIENHLGELWSLFNFLSPGLLGSSRQFTQIFRTPIEKQGDPNRKHSLNQRVYPYMLRRTKEEVIKELPSKTEVIQNIELLDEQQDLYESIRLAMHAKLQEVIEQKGLAGSQIFILDALLKLRQVCCHPRLLKLKQANQVTSSAKLDFLLNMLTELTEKNRKVLIFSSFSSMLSIISEELKKLSIDHVILTGSTLDRVTPINTFQQGLVPVFLLSLKAGGTGLNLTTADTVIHYDPWWNPAAESQATDRAHRIGQTKPIFVYKLMTIGTVEEKILIMQKKKRALLDGLFAERTPTKVGLTKEDLSMLFQPIEDLEKN